MNQRYLYPSLRLVILAAVFLTSCGLTREERRAQTRAYYDKRSITRDTTEWPVKNDAASYGRPPLAPIPPRSFEVERPVQHIGDLQDMVNTPAVLPSNSLAPAAPSSKTLSKTTKGDESKTAPVSQKRGFLGLFGRKKPKEVVQNSPYPTFKKCKGCVFGNQTTVAKKATAAAGDGSTVVQAAKNAQAAAADSGASLQQANSKQQAAAGKDISQQQVTPKKPFWEALLDNLTQPLGIVLALVAAGGIVWLVLWLRRGKKVTDTLS